MHIVVTGTGDLYNSVRGALASVGAEAGEVQVRPGTLDDAFIRLVRTTSGETEEAERT